MKIAVTSFKSNRGVFDMFLGDGRLVSPTHEFGNGLFYLCVAGNRLNGFAYGQIIPETLNDGVGHVLARNGSAASKVFGNLDAPRPIIVSQVPRGKDGII